MTTKGVTRNPLADEPEEAPQGKADRADYYDEFALPVTTRKQGVVFSGRGYNVHVQVKAPDAEIGAEKIARAVLGAAIGEIWRKARVPVEEAFRTQNVFKVAPLVPKVTFELGDLTLYASASSSDLALAQQMALDRVAMALASCRARVPGAKDVLDRYGVTVALRG